MRDGEAVIGIDLGTTYSCVAVARDGTIEIITNDQGNRTTPSIVAFDQNSERLIGEAAKNQATLNPRCTFFDVKRLIGKKFEDPEVQNDMTYLPYPVVNRDGKPHVQVNDDDVFSAEEISAMVLGKMKETAEAYLGKPVTRAVVTVPAYFNDAQRQATKDAGTIAGLNVERIINEPTAGAIAYGWKGEWNEKRKILVYDLGGGTFDVSILEIEADEFKVLATGGDTHLGGGDFDQRVMKYFIEVIKKKYRKDISGDSKALGKLRKECERAKRALSGQLTQVSVNIDCFVNGMDFSEVLTRARFEELNLDLFKKTMEVVKATMEDAGVVKGDVDEIVLVGGSTRIPRIRDMLRDMFDGKEPCRGVNPDEAVAYGAAVLGANLSVGSADVTLCDVTPLSLGVHIAGGLMSVIIPRNTPIPTKMSSVYVTVEDQQTFVPIKVYQGERPLTKDCIKLGEFNLYGLTPAPRGVTSMEETFEIDENGILTVSAKEKGSSTISESLTITSYKGDLTKTEIERMIRKAEAYLGKPVTRAVVTVPAYFNDAQRQATKDAGTIAGLKVERIINEPTAGAIAYGWKSEWKGKRKILVYDLGGGTFDVSILDIEADEYKVLATGGDTHLGGGDFDQRVMKYFIDLIKRKYRKDISGDSKALGKLRKECERAKRALSGQLTQVIVNIDCFIDGMDFSEVLTRARFEELNMDLFKKTMEVVKATMEDAGVVKGDVDEIVLVGGSTRIPRVRKMLREMFDGKEPCRGVNPDEAVAYGAAVFGANLGGALAAVLYSDVTPLSLGISITSGDLMSVIIPRNTPIPARMSNDYVTTYDQQTSVAIKVYQGERPLTKDCILLGKFDLSGLTPAPRGVTQVEAIFDIDENGILTATAREMGAAATTSKSLKITSYKGDLTKTEIERMIQKAEKMAEKDQVAKARVDARNMLEQCIYDLKNVIISGDEKMETELEDASRWLDENQDAIKEDYEKKMKQLKVKVRR
ncbi:Luminal-binding protein 2 [Linum perenne]